MPRTRNSKSKIRKQKGGRVSLPSEYFGGNSGRYFPEGSPELNPANSAYGPSVTTSHGVVISGNQMGPDMGPYPVATGNQTGGAVRMPAEYFGGNSGRYFENPQNCSHSYGPMPPNTFGRNLGPHPGQTGTLTGGGRKKRSSSKSKKSMSNSLNNAMNNVVHKKKSRSSGKKNRKPRKSSKSKSSGKKKRSSRSKRLSSRSKALRRREQRLSSRSRRVRRRERRVSSVARKLRNKKRSKSKSGKKRLGGKKRSY